MINLSYVKHCLEKASQNRLLPNMKACIKPKERSQLIAKANDLINHCFVYENVWDMEACNTPYILQPLKWNSVCHDDEEWCFMLNRMAWQSDLILAGIISEERRYFDKSLWFTLDWIKNHEQMKEELSTRTLDTGIRILNILDTLPYLIQMSWFKDEQLLTISEHLIKQIIFCKEHYQYKYHLSNWGSIQVCSILCVLPYLIEDYQNHELFTWAYQELEEQLKLQIYPDGLLWEQSTMYHVEVLNYLMKLKFHAKLHNFELPALFDEVTTSTSESLMHQITPDGAIDAFGDSDRVIARDVFVRATCLYSNEQYKFIGGKEMDLDSLYMLGSDYHRSYQEVKECDSIACFFDGADSGMYTMRSSWQSNAAFMLFTNGSLGSGHGHCDQMHISLSYQGLPFLIDSGRFTYREDHELRIRLKSVYAHNGVIIDQQEHSKPSGSWSNTAYASPLKTYSKHMENIHYLESTLLVSNPLQVWTRKICMIDQGIWFLIDELKQEGTHTFKQSFHLHPLVSVHQDTAVSAIMRQKNINLKINSEFPLSIDEDICSLRYNQTDNQKEIVAEGSFENEVNIFQVLCDPQFKVVDTVILQGGKNALDARIAQAKTCIISDIESYTFVVFHKELYQGPKLCTCDGVNFHAKSVCIHTINGKKEVQRLKM